MAKLIERLTSLQLRRAGRGEYNDGGGLYARMRTRDAALLGVPLRLRG